MLSDRMKEYIEQLYEQSLKLMESSDTTTDAIEKLNLILRIEPDNAKVQFTIGRAYESTGDHDNASFHLERARELGYIDEDSSSEKEKLVTKTSFTENLLTKIKDNEQLFNRKNAVTLASFVIPFLIRLIPELLHGYPIGYDTSHYIWAILNYPSVQKFPLFENRYAPMTYLIYYLINLPIPIHPIHTMKIIPSLTAGLLGYALYRYGTPRSNEWIGLLMAIYSSLNLASLRLSWDLHKQFTAFAFLVLALTFLKEEMNQRQWITFTILSIIAVSSHQLALIPLGLVILNTIIRRRNWRLLGVMAVLALVASPFLLRYIGPSIIPKVDTKILTTAFNYIKYVMPIQLALSFLHIFNPRKIRDEWMMASFTLSLLPFSLLQSGGGFTFSGWRFAALLFIPFSFYAAQTTELLYKTSRKKLWVVLMVLTLSAASVAPMLLGYNKKLVYTNMPKNFSDNIFPYTDQHELEALIKAGKWCSENTPEDAIILAEDSMEDWVKIFSGREVYRWWGIQYQDRLEWALEQEEDVYIVWWYINEQNIRIVKEAFTRGSNLKVMILDK